MTRELVDWRLLLYRQRVARRQGSIVCKIMRSGKNAIIKLDDLRREELPSGAVEISLPNHETWTFRFVKRFVNVAGPSGSEENQLHDLLVHWYGADVGRPGTTCRVLFSYEDGWRCRPEKSLAPASVVHDKRVDECPFALHQESAENRVPVFSLKTAAGGYSAGQEPEVTGWVDLPAGNPYRPDLFIAQVVGRSMEPKIPDGSWCLFRKGVSGSRNGRIVLAVHHSIHDLEHGGSYTLKKYCSVKKADEDEGWRHASIRLESLNPEFDPIDIPSDEAPDIRIIAEFVRVLG